MKKDQQNQAQYDHQKLEEKWQAFWESNQFFQNTPQSVGSPKPQDKLHLLFAFA